MKQREAKEVLRREAFTRLLSEVLPTALVPTPYAVVNIGCGDGRDTRDMHIACSPKNLQPRQWAVDCLACYIEYGAKEFTNPDTIFVCANAANPSILDQYPALLDLILLRHPEITRYNADIWYAMLIIALHRLVIGGRVLITVYNEPEYQLITQVVAQLPGMLVISTGLNPQRDSSLLQWSNRTDTNNCPDHYWVLMVKER